MNVVEQVELGEHPVCDGGLVGSIVFRCRSPIHKEQFALGSVVLLQLKSIVKDVRISKGSVTLTVEIDDSILSALIT